MAQQGEHNVDRLRHDALAYLEAKELSVPRGVGHPAWASLMLEDAQGARSYPSERSACGMAAPESSTSTESGTTAFGFGDS
jgi:hypothetical protein